jgi:hypothetical protein
MTFCHHHRMVKDTGRDERRERMKKNSNKHRKMEQRSGETSKQRRKKEPDKGRERKIVRAG